MAEQAQSQHAPGQHPDLPAPRSEVGLYGWLRANLFSSWANTLLTFVAAYILYIAVPPVIQWALIDADWAGDSREDCSRVGACWVFIKVWFKQLMYGRYPSEELWRINTGYVLLGAGLVFLLIPGFRWKHWVGLFLIFVYPIIAFMLFTGGTFVFDLANWLPLLLIALAAIPLFRSGLMQHGFMEGYRRLFPPLVVVLLLFVVLAPVDWDVGWQAPWPEVETPLWGGLFLTLVIGAVGIVGSLPLGIVLALGRRSEMPVVRAVSVAFIELWRGVPLITVLFMASVMFPLFLPEGMNFDKLIRALAGVMFFASAYMAEVVRGGLQAIPKGQYEAAQALGLSYWKMMGLIVMPQALKMVIPGIVNTFIGLFKDTTLVLIIGLFDFLGMTQAAGTNPDWLGFAVEGYVFTAFGFWVFCFGMSRYSQRLEQKLSAGEVR